MEKFPWRELLLLGIAVLLVLLFRQLLFVIIPVILFFIARAVYLDYKEQSYRTNKLSFDDYVMLEINITREIHRSPQAMEFVIDIMHPLGGGAMDWKHKYWSGMVLWPSSLEIVSIEGSIYFFIRVSKKIAGLVKSSMYSQFPNIEINEVEDYTKYVPNYIEHHLNWALYGVDFKLSEADFIPIKTYVEYGLDQAVGKLEEYQKIDPLTPIIEYFSTLGPGEQMWLQIIIRGDRKSTWRKDAEAFIKEKLEGGQSTDPEINPMGVTRLSHAEQEQIKLIQRSLGKHGFETIIRGIYMARKENENPAAKGFFTNPVFKPFASLYHNSIKKNTGTGFDWVWQDVTGRRDLSLKKKFFADYVRRDGFDRAFWTRLNPFWNNKDHAMILTSEELATIFHLPGEVSETPALERIEATKSQAPGNLPV